VAVNSQNGRRDLMVGGPMRDPLGTVIVVEFTGGRVIR
jgi:hypothetical protein